MTVTYDNVLDHEGLIVKIAHRYSCFVDCYSNVDRQDLIQEGWLAVVRKMDGYDPEKGKLSSYLGAWISDAMRKYIKKRSVFRKSLSNREGESLSSYTRTPNTEREQEDGEGSISTPESLENLCTSSSPEEEIMALESVEKVLRAYTRPIELNSHARRTKKYKEFKELLEEDVLAKRNYKNWR